MNRILILAGVILAAAILLFSFLNNENQTKTMESTVQTIDATQFKQQKEQQPDIVIDVRTQDEYNDGHLAEADQHYYLLNGDFEAALDSLDKNETYYLYCRSGNRSGKAAKLMIKNGFPNVYNIGGYQGLVDAGLESNQWK